MHRRPFFVVRIRFQIFADNFDKMEAESRLTSSRQQLLIIDSRYHIVSLTLKMEGPTKMQPRCNELNSDYPSFLKRHHFAECIPSEDLKFFKSIMLCFSTSVMK